MANKRAAKGAGSLRLVTKEKNGKKYSWYEGTITIGIDPGTGKQKRKTFTGKSQGEVLKAMQAAQNSVNEGSFFEPSKLTVREWFETWLSDYMAAVKPLTVQQYKSMSETHIFPALGAVKLKDLKAPQLQRFYNQLAKDGKAARRKNPKTGKMEIVRTGEPLSAKTIRNIHNIISKSLNVAVQQDMIKENVSQRCTLPKVIREEVQPLTEEQQKDFLAAIQNHTYKNIFILTMFTGLREGEAVGLTWDCIDFKKGTLKVYRQLQRIPGKWSEWRFAPLKNSKTRTIKLSSFVLQMLENQKEAQTVIKIEDTEAFVFTDEAGEHLNSSVVYENFKKVVAQIGIPEARFHDLRHTFATTSLQNGDDFKTVQDALGHSSASITLNLYAHVTERMMEEHANRQQAYIKSLGL